MPTWLIWFLTVGQGFNFVFDLTIFGIWLWRWAHGLKWKKEHPV